MPVIEQHIYIDKYDWHLTVLYNANRDISAVAEALWSMKCSSKIALYILENSLTSKNSGFCFTNTVIKATLICISESESDEELLNTVVHEAKHLQSHICSYYNIDESGEEAAYMIGDIVEKLYNVFKYELEQS